MIQIIILTTFLFSSLSFSNSPEDCESGSKFDGVDCVLDDPQPDVEVVPEPVVESTIDPSWFNLGIATLVAYPAWTALGLGGIAVGGIYLYRSFRKQPIRTAIWPKGPSQFYTPEQIQKAMVQVTHNSPGRCRIAGDIKNILTHRQATGAAWQTAKEPVKQATIDAAKRALEKL